MNAYICPYCGKSFDNGKSLGGHVTSCVQNPSHNQITQKINSAKEKTFGTCLRHLTCVVCGNEYQLRISDRQLNSGNFKKTCSSKCAHTFQSQNTDNQAKNRKIRQTAIQNNSDRYKRMIPKFLVCKNCSNNYQYYSKRYRDYFGIVGYYSQNYCCEKCMKESRSQKLAKLAKDREFGGPTNPSRSSYHKGVAYGIKYDSSWELAYIIFHKEHHINIARYNGYRTYFYNGKQYKYYPDFVVGNKIIEIKGYINDRVLAKQQFNPDIEIIGKNDITPYIQYAILNYGEKFWEHFETISK